MSRLAPDKPGKSTALKLPALMRILHHCDSCGMSVHGGGSIADAKFEIRTPKGSIYLCGHHYHKHSVRMAEHGYEVLGHGQGSKP